MLQILKYLFMKIIKSISLLLVFLFAFSIHAQKLNKLEKKIIKQVEFNNDEAILLLKKVVNINSGTLNLEGVKKVGVVFSDEFKSIL